MSKRKAKGTTLVELLVVIVVFAVGILAFVQIFPGGLGVLRDSRAMTVSRLLVRSETQRLKGSENQLPEYVSSVIYLPGGAILPDANVDPNNLMPPLNNVGTGEGRLTNAGLVLVGGNPVGDWQKVSAANKISRVIGEGRTVPAPAPALATVDPVLFGSLMHLTFGPIYYYRDPGTGIGANGLLLGYTDDFEVRPGDRNAGYPDPVAGLYEPWVAYFVEAGRTTDLNVSPMPNEDQLWFNLLNEGGAIDPHDLRLQFTFLYNFGGEIRPVDIVIPVDYSAMEALGTPVVIDDGRNAVLSLPRLIDQLADYAGANYRGLVVDSLRVQRLYEEIPLGVAFSNDPLEYKVLNANLGSVVINPSASAMRLPSSGGQEKPLKFKADYTVFDWRILKDEFTVPLMVDTTDVDLSSMDVKLVVNSIKPRESQGADGRQWSGLGSGTDPSLHTPAADLSVGSQDFVLVDMATGGVVLGNSNVIAESAYFVDKSLGYVNFKDTDGNLANGVTGALAFPDPANPGNWIVQNNVTMNGRKMRALYRAQNELSIQVMKPYSGYRVVQMAAAAPVQAGQVYVGGSGGWGLPDRLYFPVGDVGHRVTVGEIVDAAGNIYQEQQYQIQQLEQFGGFTYAVIDLPFNVANVPGVVPVKRVTGASLTVRAVWNPTTFVLGGDEVRNYDVLRDWGKAWRTVKSETFLGAN